MPDLTRTPVPTPARQSPTARVVLLGASNLTRGFPVFLSAARQVLGQPLDVLAATGRGRAFSRGSNLLGRRLCGITESALWDALASRDPLPLYALVMDIGNDLVYGATPEQLVDSVATCLDRLHERQAKIIVIQLPLATIRCVGPARFALMRRVLFRSCPLSLRDAQTCAEQVNEAVVGLALDRGMSVVAQDAAWYGIDPIHFRRRLYPRVAVQMLAPWRGGADVAAPPRRSLSASLYWTTRVPHERRLLWFTQRRAQPCGRLRDGTAVSLY